jgi:hypothetical protein
MCHLCGKPFRCGAVIYGNVVRIEQTEFSYTTISSIHALSSMHLENTTVEDSVVTEDNLTAVETTIKRETNAHGSITANRCLQLGPIVAEGSVSLDQCSSVFSISAKGHATLQNSKIIGNVSADKKITLNNVEIGGILTCSTHHLVIENSTIDTIKIQDDYTPASSTAHTPFLRESLEKLFRSKEPSSQILELKNSRIKNIIFTSNRDIVILSGCSTTPMTISGLIKN